jgi:MFS family permease
VSADYRSNFIHLYLDITWFGVLGGSAMAFVAVFAARQGASALQIGLLSAGPAVGHLFFTLPAGRWLEGRTVVKAVFWTSVFHRIFYLIWVPLPVVLWPQAQVWTLIGLTLLMSVPSVGLAIGFNAMFADIVPPEWRGHVAGLRNGLLAIAFIGVSLLCGYILDTVPFPTGYQIVFGIGFLGAAMSSLHLGLIRPLPAGQTPPRVGRSLGDMARPGLIRAIGDGLRPHVGLRFLARTTQLNLLRMEILKGPFGSVVAVLFAFHLTQYLAIPLFPLFWVNQLHLSDQAIGQGTALFYVAVFIGSMQLGRWSSRQGHKRLMAIGALLMSAYPGILAVSPGLGLFLVASLVGGLGWSLIGGAVNNYVLERVPANDRPAHLAWYNMALNAAILLGSLGGPLLGNWLHLRLALALCAALRMVAAFAISRWV